MSEYIEREKFSRLAAQLQLMTETLRDVSIKEGKSNEEVACLDQVIETLNLPILGSAREKYEKSFEMLWTQYEPGTMSIAQCVSEQEQWRLQKIQNNEPFTYFEAFIFDEGAYYRHNHLTMKIDPKPLIWPEEMDLQKFKKQIFKCPLTERFSLTKTLPAILTKAQKMGCTRDQVACVLQLLIKEEMPEHYPSIQHLKDSLLIFNRCVSLIDYNDEKMELISSIKSITRQVGDSIFMVAMTFQALMCELIAMETGEAVTAKEVVDKADYETGRVLRHFIQHETWTLYQEAMSSRYVMFKQRCNLKEKLRLIADIEEQRMLYPTFAKKITNVDFHVFNVGINQTSNSSFQNTPVHHAADYDDEDNDDDEEEDVDDHDNYPAAQAQSSRIHYGQRQAHETHANCRLCGLKMDRVHITMSCCPSYGRVRPTKHKCQICWKHENLSAYHYHSVCLNN